jgi:hypothetical protein
MYVNYIRMDVLCSTGGLPGTLDKTTTRHPTLVCCDLGSSLTRSASWVAPPRADRTVDST